MTPGRTLVVGGGQAGLAAVRALLARRLPVTGVEAGSAVGGLWRFANDSGRSVAYRTLRMNTSARRSAFAGWPYPPDTPDFPAHHQVAAYLQSFADRYRLAACYRFRTAVAAAVQAADGWRVTFADGSIEPFAQLIVATGHNARPVRPDRPGFAGRRFHTADYRDPEQLRAAHVLVVGGGASAADVAVDALTVADRVTVSVRRMPRVVPRRLLGRPIDAWNSPLLTRLPLPVRRALTVGLLRLGRGDQERYGLPPAADPLFARLPTVSGEWLAAAAIGRIELKPAVAAADGAVVRFADGTACEPGVLVEATGYRPDDPFLPPAAAVAPRYRQVAPVGWPGLYFVGRFTALGAALPVAEAQAAWVAERIATGRSVPTTPADPRPLPLIDPFPYRRQLARS